MERHLETVQKMLTSIHHRHLQSRDKVHQALSRQNEQLAAELAALKMQIGQLQVLPHAMQRSSALRTDSNPHVYGMLLRRREIQLRQEVEELRSDQPAGGA